MSDKRTVYAASVILPDRVGILRDVSTAVSAIGGNLIDLRQLVVAGCFTLTFVVTFADGAAAEELRTALSDALSGDTAAINVLPYGTDHAPVVERGSRYVFTVSGPDGPGRVSEVSQFFVERGINIEDLQRSEMKDGSILNVGLVTIPDSVDLRAVQQEFSRLLDPLGLTTRLLHENIFRATNEIGPIHALLSPVKE